MKAFLDDSGTKGTGKVLFVGGVFGTAEALADVAERWDRELRARLPLPIGYFKASEAAALKGEFLHWGRKARDQKVARLASVIDREDIVMLFGGVDLLPHKQTELAVRHADDVRKHPLNQPYLMALLTAMMAVGVECHQRKVREQVEVIVDEHVVFRNDALEQWKLVRQFMPEPLKPFMPVQPLCRDDLDFVVLQAADLLMGHARMVIEKVSRWPKIDFQKLKVSGASKFYDAQPLGELAAQEIERRLGLPRKSLKVSVSRPGVQTS